jgi:hypothetical protein
MKSLNGAPGPFSYTIDLGANKGKKEIYFTKPDIIQTNAIEEEFNAFATAIVTGTLPQVTIEDGYNALYVAGKITKRLRLTEDLLQ